jgi:hypothetical protein
MAATRTTPVDSGARLGALRLRVLAKLEVDLGLTGLALKSVFLAGGIGTTGAQAAVVAGVGAKETLKKSASGRKRKAHAAAAIETYQIDRRGSENEVSAKPKRSFGAG